MKEDRPLTREEIEDLLNRFHVDEYEWYIDDKEDDYLCSSSEEDAELVEKAIKSLINQYQTEYISKDKIREKIKELKKECADCSFRKMLNCKKQCTIGGTIKSLEDLLKE